MKMNETRRLWFFAALVLAVPAVLNHLVPVGADFDPEPLAELRAKQPHLVLIGDSMLDSRIDVPLLEQRLYRSQRVEMVWGGGAASASWYLLLKNYVVASGVRPRVVCIFFRDRLLTDASFRTGGIFRSYLESLMREDEPVVRLVLGDDAGGNSTMERWVTRIYPLNGRRQVLHDRINRTMFRVVTPTASAAKALKKRVNKTFDVVQMRGELLTESTEVGSKEAVLFDPNPNRSFLPHIVDEAAKAGLPLCFVRVKRHPDPDGRVPQSDSLRRYTADLRAWLEARGCVLIDESDDPAFTADMYLKAKDDHIGTWAKTRSTEIYAEKLRRLLPP